MLSDILHIELYYDEEVEGCIADFVFRHLDPIFLCMVAMHGQHMNWKEYVMICLFISVRTLLGRTNMFEPKPALFFVQFQVGIGSDANIYWSNMILLNLVYFDSPFLKSV